MMQSLRAKLRLARRAARRVGMRSDVRPRGKNTRRMKPAQVNVANTASRAARRARVFQLLFGLSLDQST